MSRKQLENFLEQEKRNKPEASITRFAIDAEASDEERAVLKRELAIENLNRNTRKRAKRRKQQKIQRNKSRLKSLLTSMKC